MLPNFNVQHICHELCFWKFIVIVPMFFYTFIVKNLLMTSLVLGAISFVTARFKVGLIIMVLIDKNWLVTDI